MFTYWRCPVFQKLVNISLIFENLLLLYLFEVVNVSERYRGHFGQIQEMILNCCNLKCFKMEYELVKSIIQTLFQNKIITDMAFLFAEHSYLL